MTKLKNLGEFKVERNPNQTTVTRIALLDTPVPAFGYDSAASAVEVWYDRYQRLWTVYLIETAENRYQVGAAQYAVDMAEAFAEAEYLANPSCGMCSAAFGAAHLAWCSKAAR